MNRKHRNQQIIKKFQEEVEKLNLSLESTLPPVTAEGRAPRYKKREEARSFLCHSENALLGMLHLVANEHYIPVVATMNEPETYWTRTDIEVMLGSEMSEYTWPKLRAGLLASRLFVKDEEGFIIKNNDPAPWMIWEWVVENRRERFMAPPYARDKARRNK